MPRDIFKACRGAKEKEIIWVKNTLFHNETSVTFKVL